MIKLKMVLLAFMVFFMSCKSDENPTSPPKIEGRKVLMMGNSFFRPYAENLAELVFDASIENHSSIVAFRGGEGGWPRTLWNNSTTDEHQLIKSVLDEGDVEIFGMTAGYDTAAGVDLIYGHRAWIDYAVERNPGIVVFIAIPQVDFPANWEQLASDFGFTTFQDFYSAFVDLVHDSIVDPLRVEFPNTKIFTIPTGWASVELTQMKLDNDLLDDIGLMGAKPTSLFTDQKGHQGQIIIETGSLVWLNSIYGVDLTTNTYNTGFNTDLHAIARRIVENHDPNYRQ